MLPTSLRRLAVLAACSVLAALAAGTPAHADERTPVPFRLTMVDGKIEVLPVIHGPATGAQSVLAMPQQTQPNCFAHSLSCGQQINDFVDPTGCQFENAPNYYNEYLLIGAQGDQGTATVTATYSPQVILYDESGATVAFDQAPGDTTSSVSYTLPANGRYYLVVTSVQPISSGNFTLTLTCHTSACQLPFALNGPLDSTINPGENALLAVAAGGVKPISYEWYRVAGLGYEKVYADSTVYLTPALTQTTQYFVKLTNSCGSTNSRVATVTVRGGVLTRRRSVRH